MWTNIQEVSGYSTAPNTAKINSWKAWNSTVDYPSRESKHDINESEGNMFNPVFKDVDQDSMMPRGIAKD